MASDILKPTAEYYQHFKDLSLYQFRDNTFLQDNFAIKADSQEEREELFCQVLESFYWGTAEGAQLDLIGKIVGRPRNGFDDTKYETLIRLQIQINISGGQIPILLDTLELVFGATYTLYYQDFDSPEMALTVEILTNGSVGVLDDYNIISEDGLFNIVDESGDYNIIGSEPDATSEDILLTVLPAGVALKYLYYLVDESGDYNIVDEDGNKILV